MDDAEGRPSKERQLALDGFEEIGLGLDQLPQGVGECSVKELKFVNRLLQHGQLARAAQEAGYQGDREGAGVWASKTLRKPKVFRVYQAALRHVSADADKLVGRVCERSVLWHEKAKACAQEVAELDALLLERADSTTKGKEPGDTSYYETRRDRMMKQERHYAQLAAREDTLLGSLLGRLNLNVNVDKQVTHYVAGNEFTQEFAAQRREWEAARNGSRN